MRNEQEQQMKASNNQQEYIEKQLKEKQLKEKQLKEKHLIKETIDEKKLSFINQSNDECVSYNNKKLGFLDIISNYFKLNMKNILLILAGNTIYALAVAMFILPNNLITGGTTGLSLFFYHQFHIPMSLFISTFNITMFILGAMVLGRKFALTTIVSTFYYPFIFSILQNIKFLHDMTDDTLLSVLLSGIMIGFGIGIVIRSGASTGGMDIPPLVLNKKIGLSVSVGLYAFDFIILLLQMLFSDKEKVLYGILLVLIYTVVLDKILLIGKSQLQVKIVSDKYEEINQMITSSMDRGSTLIYSSTGYCRKENMVVLTVITNRELPKLNDKVLQIDPNAFMIINNVNEVKGRGFTTQKVYR